MTKPTQPVYMPMDRPCIDTVRSEVAEPGCLGRNAGENSPLMLIEQPSNRGKTAPATLLARYGLATWEITENQRITEHGGAVGGLHIAGSIADGPVCYYQLIQDRLSLVARTVQLGQAGVSEPFVDQGCSCI